jgi:PHD/YefM family antitoxin component YafN of YafNO toxin-antitoxin module
VRNKATPIIRSIPIAKAEIHLGQLVKRVHVYKQYLILKEDGVPIVAIMDIDEFEDYLELNDPKAQRAIRKSTEEFRAGKSRPAQELLEELRREKKPKARMPHR